ncbi:hypothetical protein HY417_00820 [Candidatus Kaiserbacteria bacterium]|nr:hypothetical protein [Candidatus Kaiserbacteria bacterium]
MHLWSAMRDTWLNREEPENLRKLADAYWWVLLLLSVLTFVGLVAYSGVKFYELFNEDQETPLLSSGGGIQLNVVDLRSVLEAFEERKARYEYFKKNLPQIADPSR